MLYNKDFELWFTNLVTCDQDVSRPSLDDWESGLKAVEAALELEKTVNQSLLDLHGVASSHNDAQVNNQVKL